MKASTLEYADCASFIVVALLVLFLLMIVVVVVVVLLLFMVSVLLAMSLFLLQKRLYISNPFPTHEQGLVLSHINGVGMQEKAQIEHDIATLAMQM